MILISVVVTVGMMTFISWYYKRFYVNNANTVLSEKIRHRKFTFDYFSFHLIYVINIMTNQGKYRLSSIPSLHISARLQYLKFYYVSVQNNRMQRRFQSPFVSNCGWILGFGRHGLSKLLLGYCHLFTYSSKDETSRRIFEWLGYKWRCGSHYSIRYCYWPTNIGTIKSKESLLLQLIFRVLITWIFFLLIYAYIFIIQSATSGIYKKIGDKARSAPDQIFAEPNKLIAKLATGHYGFPFVSYTLGKFQII